MQKIESKKKNLTLSIKVDIDRFVCKTNDMFEFLSKMILGWGTVWQFLFVILSAGLLTNITCSAITGFTQHFMYSITILFRGWPENIDSDDDVGNIE